MGKKSRAKRDRKAAVPRPPAGISPELAARLQRGLSPEELSDPEVLRQIMAAGSNPANDIFGNVWTFTKLGSAPGVKPPFGLPELAPGEAELDEEPQGVVPLRPSQVIDLHASLYERLARRDPRWVSYFDAFIEDALRRGVESEQDAYEKWGVMFQPAVSAEQYVGILARQLSTARTYQVTAKMSGVVGAMYEKAAGQVNYFQSEDIPWPSGFVYLDRPLTLRDRNGREVRNRALSWNMERGRLGDDMRVRPAVRIACWSWWSDQDDYWTPETAAVIRDAMGGLSLAHSVIIPFGVEFRSLDERRAEAAAGIASPPDDISRWLHALWLVMESEIATLRRAADIERPARRRALHSLNHADVTVVLLRRSASKEPEGGEPGHRFVDWTHRWPVQGFWRHRRKQSHHAVPDEDREHCAACGTAISWVHPHLRPNLPGLPLQAKPQLYLVSR